MDDNQNNKELGLIDILQIIGQWIVALVMKFTNWFLFLFFFGIKRWKYFVIIGVLAGIYSVVIYRLQNSQYEANMMLRSNAIEATQMKNYLDAYASLLGNSLLDDATITEKTGLDSTQRSLMTSVSTFYCVDKDRDGVADLIDRNGRYGSSDPTIDSLNLSVNLRFEDVSLLPLVAKSLTDYISSNSYIIKCNTNRLNGLIKRRALIAGEIALLDTLQKRTYLGLDIANTLKVDNGNVMVDNRKVIVYWDKLALLEKAEEIDQQLEVLADPVTIMEDFVIAKSAINTLSSIVKKNVFLALVIGYLIFFFSYLYSIEKEKYLK